VYELIFKYFGIISEIYVSLSYQRYIWAGHPDIRQKNGAIEKEADIAFFG
jgi:hypothetical protein